MFAAVRTKSRFHADWHSSRFKEGLCCLGRKSKAAERLFAERTAPGGTSLTELACRRMSMVDIALPGPVSHEAESFWRRWLEATNHKDIGTLYLCGATLAGILAVSLSIVMRMELQSPGVQFLKDAAGNPDGSFVSAE